MRIVLAQSHIVWEDTDKNIENAVRIVQENEEADLIFFPEMSFTGFSMNTDHTSDIGMYTIQRMKMEARRYNTAIGFGWVRQNNADKNKSDNVYTILDSTGKPLFEYIKIHPFSYSGEDKLFKGGNRLSTFEYKGVSFAVFICYDLRFPEIFRMVADKTHVIIIPACWPAGRSDHWKVLLRARAIENQVYIMAVNCQGNIGEVYYSGDSCVINPVGEVIEMLTGKEGIISFDFIDDVDDYRSSFPVLKDRRVRGFHL